VSEIKRFLAFIIIIGLIVIGLFVLEPFHSEPPTPNVTAGDTKIATTQGSYCWNGLFSSQCVDKVYKNPLEMAKEHKPTVVSPNEEIKIEFKKAPIAGTMKVEQWIGEDNREIETNNNSIIVPTEKGVYVYYVLVDWKQGDGNYAFSVEVE